MIASTSALMLNAVDANAWKQDTHKQIVIDAVNYMQANPNSTEFAKLKATTDAIGITVQELGEILGQGAYDVDDFQDTFICGAVTGNCQFAPVYSLGASVAQYTSYWHFQNHTRGGDAHGNDIGGYNYDLLTVWGSVDNLAASWLYGDHLDDGNGGMDGWWGAESSKYNSYGVTESNYRIGSYSNKSMYEDFESIPFQPIDNLGQYWYQQFLAAPSAQTLGFVMHTTDLLQPHHTWTTSDLNHAGWESWVKDYYFSENLNDFAAVEDAMASFTAIPTSSDDIRPLLTEGGAISYSVGGIVLSSEDHNDRLQVAKQTIPHAIAMTVHLLNHAFSRL